VAKSATATANGSYNWSFADTTNYNSAGTWQKGYFSSSLDGLTWNHDNYSLQFAVYATPIPEPSVAPLFLIGSGVLAYARRSSSKGVLVERK
jgi:hypothetical protein